MPYVLGGIGWVRNTLTITAIPVAPWPDTGLAEPSPPSLLAAASRRPSGENATALTEPSALMLPTALPVAVSQTVSDLSRHQHGSPPKRVVLPPSESVIGES